MITISMQADSSGKVTHSIEYPIDFEYACEILGIAVGAKNSRETRRQYRDALGLDPGEVLDQETFIKLSLMHQFVNYRHGRNFSRKVFTRLAVKCKTLANLQAYLEKTYNITPHPLTTPDRQETSGDASQST